MNEIIDPMATTEFVVDHALHNLCEAVSDIDALRRSNDARVLLMDSMSVSDIELCRDRLSRIIDDIGAHHG